MELERFLEYQARLERFDKEIESQSGKYFALSRSGLVTDTKQIRAQVKPNEALLVFTRVSKGYAIGCMTQERTTFSLSEIAAEDIDRYISTVRRSLQTEIGGRINDDLSFPAEDAFNLYRALLLPVKKCIDPKKKLVLVLPHELLTVPFNALLTERAIVSKGSELKTAPWAIRIWSFSVAQSIQLFVSSRMSRLESFSRKGFLGVGDPVLAGRVDTAGTAIEAPSQLFASRGLANVRKLREMMSLPETKEEIESLAARFRSTGASILLGSEATEKRLRGLDLRNYRVIAFATHALVAGEFGPGTEPALVLTPGDESNPSDDGLLTASEVSLLAMNADVVVLSGCNTATSTGSPDARGLSGLVGAFLFSGARSVLASQWPVLSFAATDLVTKAFELSEKGRPLGDALRVAMLQTLDHGASEFESHPRVWAPFVLIGNGELIIGSGDNSAPKDAGGLRVEWEVNLGDEVYGEVTNIEPAKGNGVWISGLSDPTEKRASSFIERRTEAGELVKRIHSTKIVWSQLASTEDGGVLVLGSSYSETMKSGALLTRLSSTGQELWSVAVDTDRFDHSVAALRDDTGRIIWTIYQTHYDSTKSDLNTLVVLRVSESGKIERRIKIDIPKGSYTLNFGSALTVGKLLVVLGSGLVDIGDSKPKRNLVTGRTEYCGGLTYMTNVYAIDMQSGTLVRTSVISHFWGLRLRGTNDGRILAAGGIAAGCGVSTTAAVIELDKEFKAKNIEFLYAVGLNGRATDVAISGENKMAVVGVLETPFDLPPFKPVDLKVSARPQPFGDLNRDKDKTLSAFLAVKKLGQDRYQQVIMTDLRGRLFQSSAFANNGDILTGGVANGSSGWVGQFPRSMGE